MVFPVQGYSLARIGLYEGLVRSNSVRATFMAIWKAGLLPWVMFIGFMVTWETARRHFRALPRITEQCGHRRVDGRPFAGVRYLPGPCKLAASSKLPVSGGAVGPGRCGGNDGGAKSRLAVEAGSAKFRGPSRGSINTSRAP